MRKTDRPLEGILLVCFATAFFAALDSTGKLLTQRFPVRFLVWARYTGHLLMMLALLAPSMRGGLARTQRLRLQIVRALALVAASLSFLSALARLPLAEGTAIMFMAPLAVTLLAGPVLGERVSRAVWAGVIAGFCGVLLVVRPAFDVSPAGVAMALGAMAFLSAYHLLTRKLAATEHPLTTLFYTALVGTAAMSASLPFVSLPQEVASLDWLLIASLGLFGGAGHFLLIRAFHCAPAATLMPITYLQLFWAVALGWVMFAQFPGGDAATGMSLIAASGAWVAWNERQRR